MRGMHIKSLWGGVAAGALLFTVGCGATQNTAGVRAQELAGTQQAGVPVVVSCEPHQRTLVRPVVINGATVSQVECVAADAQATAAYAQPAAYAAPAAPVRYVTARPAPVVYDDGLEDARVVRTSSVQPARARQTVYQEPVARQTRSVKKSAAIIGSSAAVGAGIGALAKGKKGALIGAAIGGGGAAVWDQITRRK